MRSRASPRRAPSRRAACRRASRIRQSPSGSSRSEVALSFPPAPARPRVEKLRCGRRRAGRSARRARGRRRARRGRRTSAPPTADRRRRRPAVVRPPAPRAACETRRASPRASTRRRSRGRCRSRTSISTRGQYVIPSPYGRQRPRRTSAESPTRSRKSATRRDLPIPAGPSSVKSRHVRSATASS